MLKRKTAREVIVELLTQEKPPSISQIIKQVSVDQRMVSPATARIYVYQEFDRLKKEGREIVLPVSKRGEVKHEDLKPISDLHRRVGYRLNYYRDITEGKSPEQFCALYDYFSPRILRQMELGAFDFTLTDLAIIGDVLGRSLPELIAPIDTGAKCPSSTPKSSFSTLRI